MSVNTNSTSPLTFIPRAFSNGIRGAVKAVSTTANSATAAVRQDSANLSTQSPKNNPYANMGAQATTVTVEPWKPGQTNANSSLSGILLNQGYSQQEIFEGQPSLLDRVAAANDLRNPNLIHADQKLIVPSRAKEEGAGETGSSYNQNEGSGSAMQDWVEDIFNVDFSSRMASTKKSADKESVDQNVSQEIKDLRLLRDNAETIGNIKGVNGTNKLGEGSFSDEDLDALRALNDNPNAEKILSGEMTALQLSNRNKFNPLSGVFGMFTDGNESQVADTVDKLMSQAPDHLKTREEKAQWIKSLAGAASRIDGNSAMKEAVESQDSGNDSWLRGRNFSYSELNEVIRLQTAKAY